MVVKIQVNQAEFNELMKLAGRVSEAPKKMSRILNTAAQKAQGAMVARIDQSTKVHTTALRQVKYEPSSPSRLTSIAYTNAPYAGYIDQGTKPHLIRPRTKKILARAKRGDMPTPRYFWFENSQYWFFRNPVHHPGIRARNFSDAGAQAARNYIIEALWNIIDGTDK